MSTDAEQRLREINAAKEAYNQYTETQRDFQAPQAHISVESESDNTTKVHMEVQYNGNEYYFKSVEEKDAHDIYQYLHSQPSVKAKYTNGSTMSLAAATARVHTLVNRFQNKHSPQYLYSGFVVSDAQTDTFLGFANLGSGCEPGISEMAFLNRQECWSQPPNVLPMYEVVNVNTVNKKPYSGVGTVEVCTLLQYAARLKQDGYLINGHTLKAVVATARVDNEGSWKSCSKAGMMLDTVDVSSHYGSNLRYQLRRNI